jgi:hypothetical protein
MGCRHRARVAHSAGIRHVRSVFVTGATSTGLNAMPHFGDAPPGVVESERADTISDASARDAMKTYRRIALAPDAIARAIAYAIEHPDV